MYVLLNSHELDFNIYPITVDQEFYVFESERDGVMILNRNKKQILAKPGFIASTFTKCKNNLHCFSALYEKKGTYELTTMVFKLEKPFKTDVPMIVRFEKTRFKRSIDKRAGQQEICMLDKDFMISTCPDSIKTAVVLNG